MARRFVWPIAVALSFASFTAVAEVIRLPFFLPPPEFAGGGEAFPSVVAWAGYDQSLDQSAAPDSAHCLDTAALFSFYSNEGFAVRGLAREMFQFRRHPDGDFLLWGRAVVTDLRLDLSVNLRPFVASVGYRHDCKHDVETNTRGVIHDALFARFTLPMRDIPPLRDSLRSRAGFAVEAEVNLPPIFQSAGDEPDRARATAECSLIPFATRDGVFSAVVDGRLSAIDRASGARVIVDSGLSLDWLARVGIEIRPGRLGGLRLGYSLERLTDDWASLSPRATRVSSVNLLIFYGF